MRHAVHEQLSPVRNESSTWERMSTLLDLRHHLHLLRAEEHQHGLVDDLRWHRASSKKMRQAFLERAIWNSSRTMRAPSPTYFCTSSLPMTRMKHASVRFATARASSVLPVPAH